MCLRVGRVSGFCGVSVDPFGGRGCTGGEGEEGVLKGKGRGVYWRGREGG